MPKEIYDYRTHGDFKKYYDTKLKRTYWTLGYASNITIPELYQLAQHFAEENKVPLDEIKFEEILNSRRFKYFKVLFAINEHAKPDTEIDESEDVWGWLTN